METPSTVAALPSAAVQTAANGAVVGSRRCEVCGAELLGRRKVACSEKCRAERWRRRQESARQKRDREVWALLLTAQESVAAAMKRLETP